MPDTIPPTPAQSAALAHVSTEALTIATTRMPHEGTAMQRALAEDIDNFVMDWMAENAGHLLIEMTGAVDDAVCQRNDFARKVA